MTAADDITRAAALDPNLDDDAYVMVTRALRGLDPITGQPGPIPVPVLTPDMPAVAIDLADYRGRHGTWEDRTHHLTAGDGPDADGHVVYIGNRGYRHDELPHVIAWLTAAYRSSTPHTEDEQ